MNEVKADFDVGSNSLTLFKPGSWLTKIDFINHLVLFNNILITVLSEQEGGKTSFSTLLKNNLDPQIKSILMKVKVPCDREYIINDIATQLHLNHDTQTDIASVVSQVNERKAHVLLIIDDAHHLPESLVKEIAFAIKKQDNFGFFHLCFISDYSIVATLNSLAPEQFKNLIHTIELGALSESETKTYVLQRAMSSGLINKPLTDVQIKQFYELTKGNLAKINSGLESFVFKCFKRKKSNKMMLLKKTTLAVVGVVACGFSYNYFNDNYKITKISDLVLDKPVLSQIETITGTSFIESAQNGVVEQKINIKPAEKNEILASYIASWQDLSKRQFVHNELPKKQILEGFDEEEDDLTSTVALIDKVVVIPTVKRRQIEEESISSVQILTESEDVYSDKQSTAKMVINPANNSHSKLFTIQLAASHNLNDIQRFRKNNKLMDKTLVRQFTNEKGIWYILTMGEYSNRNLASVRAKQLRQELVKLNPWIRPVSGLSNVG